MKRTANQIEQLDILFGRCGDDKRSSEVERWPNPDINGLFSASNTRGGATARNKASNTLTRQIIAFIRSHGGQAERISIMGRQERRGNGLVWTKSHMTIGTADISATIQGRSVKIEVKIGRDRQSEEQRLYQRDIEAAGGLYYIARDFDSFVAWYQTNWGSI